MSTKATHSTHRITNTRSGEIVAECAQVAETFFQRTKGLLGRASFEEGEALIIPSCRMVHMFFMRFAVDLVFCSSENVVIAVQKNLRPWRISKYVLGARAVVELPLGTIEKAAISAGDTLAW